ncbi:uncharacterized protein LOC131868140 [Cryptomeria japonica]|uniref:uncharacterized protein LOC131868140 n=1 Tax=Cryptomeria japonica TaxID=3369 RepID=UPI0027DA4D4D|nr:uncharacterized protein LOC131868140 [Cryptomeria japonica]
MSWLNRGQQVLVDEQSWVDFQIGGYRDRILCDVIPMDACHLLLGRPWRYDLNAKHDGKKNTYTITKNGESFTLNPLLDDGVGRQVGASVMIVREKEFLETLTEGDGQGFSLFLKPKDELDLLASKEKDTPKEVLSLLEKYKGIVVEEMSNTLLPIRDISHHIYLIPCATLPNKAMYKMTPSQNEEIARKVKTGAHEAFVYGVKEVA